MSTGMREGVHPSRSSSGVAADISRARRSADRRRCVCVQGTARRGN
jgi:hypothetical protein